MDLVENWNGAGIIHPAKFSDSVTGIEGGDPVYVGPHTHFVGAPCVRLSGKETSVFRDQERTGYFAVCINRWAVLSDIILCQLLTAGRPDPQLDHESVRAVAQHVAKQKCLLVNRK